MDTGWLDGVARHPSPHFDGRPQGCPVSLIVLHNITLPPGQFGTGCVPQLFDGTLDCGADPFFESLRGLRVSSHFFVARDGSVTQFVSMKERAWHAGVSNFFGRTRCNDFSVGIEIEGTDFVPFDDRQYPAVAALIARICKAIPTIGAVAGHSDIAPGRKTDPGPFFDWKRLRRESAIVPLAYPYQEQP